MAIVRYEPWALMNRLHDQLGQIFGDNFAAPAASSSPNVAWIPSVDVHEEADRFVVFADVPGVEPKDIEVTAEDGVLTIRGERKAEKRENSAGFERVERITGNFVRRFTLPETAQADSIRAKQTNGVLEVSIPKQPKVQPKRVTVEAA
jgi:HSP20 family protein